MLSSRVMEMAKIGLQMWKSSRSNGKRHHHGGSKMSSSTPTSPTSPTSPSDFIFRVILSYSPQQEGQIPLTTGDVVTEINDLGNGWMLGRNVSRDCAGIFPSKCIRPMSDISPSSPASEQISQVSASAKTLRPSKKPPPVKRRGGGENSGKVSGSLPARNRSYAHVKPGGRDGADPPPVTKPSPRKVRLVEGDRLLPVAGGEPSHNVRIIEPRTVDFCPQHFIEHEHPPVSPDSLGSPETDEDSCLPNPVHPNRDPSGDQLSPSDVEYNSLPTPKHGKFAPAKKPHLVVKPNQGSKLETRMEPTIREDCVLEEDEEDQVDHMNVPPMEVNSYGPIIATTRMRTTNPPAQLGPLNKTGPHRRPLTRNVTDADKVTDPEHPCDNRQKVTLLDLGSVQDRSTSPMTVTGIPAECATLPQHSEYAHEEFERDNMANETMQNSPNTSRQEKYASINKPYYRDYRTLECPPDGNYSTQLRYKPILKNRHQKVADSSKGQHIYYREEQDKRTSCTLVLSIIGALFFGSLMFLWMYYYLGYALYVALGLCGALAIILVIFFALSRMCRCMAAILFPSLCTTRGRIAFLVLITGFLLGGPVVNVYRNMNEVSRSMSCSAEQTYNQTMLLLQPFDAMMIKLNETVLKLQQSAHQVHSGLRPLEEGLDKVEMDIDNGRIQLQGTRKTCISLVDNAYHRCEDGIESAKNKCLGVIEALGNVYLLTRNVLDRINPEHWASGRHIELKKRQLARSNEDLRLPNTDRDMCEQLDLAKLCQTLNNSEMICQPSNWAGEAIQEAINETQAAMHNLEVALHFKVSSEPYNTTRIKASKIIYEVQMSVQRDFAAKTLNFEMVIVVILKIMPVAVLLLVYVAYNHVKCYLCSDTYDNTYITGHFKALDTKRSEVAGDSLLPLKKYERNYLIDTTSAELSPPENGLYRIGLCVLFLHFLVSFTCYAFDYILYWILALIEKHANPTFDATGRDSLEMVVSGEGVIVDLLDVFLEGFHPGKWFGYSANTYECLAKPHEPSLIFLLVIILMYFVLFVMILLKGYILRFRNFITGYFYPERRKARIVHLYNVILNQRTRMPKILQMRARLNYREQQVLEKVSFCHQLGAKCYPCRVFLYKKSHCLVCNALEDQSFRDCETDKCYGVYCADCYEDLARTCPLCLHGMEVSDEDEYEDLEDDLQPYHRSSKIYL